MKQPKPLTDDELQDIQQRAQEACGHDADRTDIYNSAMDVPELITEINRLKTVLELRNDNHKLDAAKTMLASTNRAFTQVMIFTGVSAATICGIVIALAVIRYT